MALYTAATAECLIFTFKEGLLSKVAHDLKLKVAEFEVNVGSEPLSVEASFDTNSLQVVEAMKDGRQNSGALSDSDKLKIAKQIADTVLQAKKHPKVRFVSHEVTETSSGCLQIAGTLSLHGVDQALTVTTRQDEGSQIAELTLHQPDFGITPFRAMMGTLKVKADVKIQLSVPL